MTHQRPSPLPGLSRNTTVVLTVLLLHGAVLWAMQSGLLQRVTEVLVPAEMLVEIMAPATPAPAPQPAPPPKALAKPVTPPKNVSPQPAPAPVPTPQTATAPLAIAPSTAAPAPSAAAPTATAHANSSNNANGSSSAPSAPPAPPAPPKVELPSSDADYLNNAKPAYPSASKRLRETGLVVVRVFIDADGQASQASVKQSSGFDRLDQTSVETALKWRYVPGKKAGVPQGMWFDVPFNWQLTR
ncbi:energy transducer TonB [Rhodoferax mekongensis]|uniref:energy transducer TonB n=1 Tax=Rhodoferax mekongensis TaxID=3068341 RepID=UPI0028BEBFB6|nr:energy transducer TonB [Rhodoferax sp. TBRC 17199]MDT7515272.1 energy transducer TonB [Rhodoferax sp. TBRC 17199]